MIFGGRAFMKRTVRIAHRLALVLKSYCIRYIQNRFCSLFLSAKAIFLLPFLYARV